MKVFLTGGTGYVGGAVAQELSRRGHAIRALVRRPARAPALRDLDAELVTGDLTESRELAGSARGCDAVIHLVGIIREKGRATFEAIHVQGTEHVLQAAKDAGVRKFVHMSALGARPEGAAYHRTKFEAESRVKGSGLPYAVFRPAIIFGRDSPVVQLWLRMVRWSPVIPVFGDGRYRLQLVALPDVAAAFVRAAEREDLRDATLELVGREMLAYDEILDAIAEAMRKRIRKWHIPLSFARPPIRIAAALRLPSPVTPDQLRMLLEENVAQEEGNALREVFGIEPLSFRRWIEELV